MKHGWPLEKVGELFNVQLGKMLSPKAKEGEQLPYLANFNVQWGKFNLENVKSMHFTESEKEKYSFRQGDILMCEGGEGGRCAIWNERSTNFYYQKALHRLRPKDKKTINPYFMCIYMEHVTANNGVAKIVGETSIAHLTREKLCALEIPCPSKEQQDKIVKTIRTWDTAIEKTERLIAAKEKQLNALYQNYFQPGSPENKNWQSHRIGEFVNVRKERSVPTEEMPLYSLTIEDGVTAKTDRYNREFLVKDQQAKTYKVAHPRDIVFNPSNLRWGAIARSEVPTKVTLSPIYEVLEVNDSLIDNDFLTHAITCPRQVGIFATKVEGTLIERMAVKVDVFQLSEILVPQSVEEQQQVAKILNAVKREARILRTLAEKYRVQKRDLMRRLLTGEWRIKR